MQRELQKDEIVSVEQIELVQRDPIKVGGSMRIAMPAGDANEGDSLAVDDEAELVKEILAVENSRNFLEQQGTLTPTHSSVLVDTMRHLLKQLSSDEAT